MFSFWKESLFLLNIQNQFSSVQFSRLCPTLCNPKDCSTPDLPVHHQLQVYSNLCPLSRWCHPTISFYVVPFYSHLQSFPASGSFQMSHFALSDQSTGVSASASVLPMNIQDWPGASMVAQMLKHLPAMRERPRFDPWVRKICWRRKWQPSPVFFPAEFHEQRILTGYSHGVAKSQTWLSDITFFFFLSFFL